MQLQKLKIENFKKITSAEFELADVNILVGANGSGKSSIIQAVHLACCVMRQADRVDPASSAAVGVETLDYLPTDNYKTLGHGANWGNNAGTPASKVQFTFAGNAGQVVAANCNLRSARNAGISITGTVPPELVNILRAKKKFFSAYIPGISGIPNREEKRSAKVVLKACSFGDSNVILRNVLLLLKTRDANNITLIENWISKIIEPIRISVNHDEEKDQHIGCTVEIGGVTKPIELVGTGYLQLIQIFGYILLFAPGVLLIDEPDIHLHPNVQERLVGVLALIARERGIKILMTTHSPFLVRGAPLGTSVSWLNGGKVESSDRQAVELVLGWGAFGKRIIIVSEDSNTALLRKLISQWPELDRVTTFYPGGGYKGVPTAKQAGEIAAALGGKYKIVVHRDRDSLSDAEVQQVEAAYQAGQSNIWFPAESDIEAYFCQPQFLETFLGCTNQDAAAYVQGILQQQAIPIRQQFDSQRASHNEELYKGGGSPTNDAVWQGFQTRTLRGAKGKYVFAQLKNAIPANAFREERIVSTQLNGTIALDLKHRLEQLLAP